jgi:hypothetical protein
MVGATAATAGFIAKLGVYSFADSCSLEPPPLVPGAAVVGGVDAAAALTAAGRTARGE